MIPEQMTIQIDNQDINIHVRVNLRARRLSLKYHPLDNTIWLTLPPRVQQQNIFAFIERSKDWLAKISRGQNAPTPLQEGQVIPILGTPHTLRYAYAESPHIEQSGGELIIKGFDAIVVPGLAKDWLRNHLYQFTTERSNYYAKQIGKTVQSITVKDTKSRWGSCTRYGHVNYSWRLVFAPEEVASYVCAHEVAHLVEMNHSPKFWDIVSQLCPDYSNLRKWLKSNGNSLFRYG